MTVLESMERDLNPFPLYRQMRETQPVYFDPQRQNWNVFRYEDVYRVLSEFEIFSSHFMRRQPQHTEQPFSASIISTDPPRHRKLRALVTQAFTPRAVEALAPRISEIVQEYLDRVTPQGEMDIIRDLGTPLPVIVIAEMLGIPSEDRERFKAWSDEVVLLGDMRGEINPERFNNPAILEMSMYFLNIIEQRRKQPGDDLISGLLEANVDGEQLTLIELLGFCALLLVAGNETTTNLIGNAMLTFSEHPETWQQLRNHRDLLPQAIEEVLRYRSPVQSMFRVTRQETVIGDQSLPEGVPIVAWIGSANHDEAQFPEAELFDIQRAPNRHLAFGQGIHYCLGAPLARLEARIAIGAMLERFVCIERQEGEVERQPSHLVYGLKRLPVTFPRA